METLLLALLGWIAANTAYDTAAVPLPEVVPLTPDAIRAEYFHGAGVPAPTRGGPEVFALYDPGGGSDGRIFIVAPELTPGLQGGEDPLENPVFQERLLHELVHHVQHQSGAAARYACFAEGEPEAYRLGGLFLQRHHANDPLPNRAFWGRIYGQCD